LTSSPKCLKNSDGARGSAIKVSNIANHISLESVGSYLAPRPNPHTVKLGAAHILQRRTVAEAVDALVDCLDAAMEGGALEELGLSVSMEERWDGGWMLESYSSDGPGLRGVLGSSS